MAGCADPTVVPVILAGGNGSRLWPLSREQTPKQFLPLVSDRSLLQQTLLRVQSIPLFSAPLMVTGEQHRFLAAEQSRAVGVTPSAILLEPAPRSTAPAIAAAALWAERQHPGAVLVVMPSDHVIGDVAALAEAVEAARMAADENLLVTFGAQANSAHSGYGYLRMGERLRQFPGIHAVREFVEKPSQIEAQRMLAQGGWLWNCGIFAFRAEAILAALNQYAPEVSAACRAAVDAATPDLGFIRLAAEAFARAPAVPIDTAVMERATGVVTVPVEMKWSDAGTWAEIWELSAKDAHGNAAMGKVVALDSRNSLIRSEGPLVGCLGLTDIMVVATSDAVLVADRSRSEEVKTLVSQFCAQGAAEAMEHPVVYRPWGSFATLYRGERFQVKHIEVKPGERLSLQKHFHRAEHWVVVKGTAQVTCGSRTELLRENESLFIPLGELHRLENPGRIPLCLIEVQSGAYLGEDDILRYDDCYGRTATAPPAASA